MQLFIASNTKAGGHTSVAKYVAKKLFHLLLRGHPLLRLNRHGDVKSMKVKTKLLLGLEMMRRLSRIRNKEREEDSEDELTTLAVPIKTKKSSGSGKKCSRTIQRSIVINLSDSEYDMKDDDKSPNSKKPFVAVDEEPASQKATVCVKLEKNLEKDVDKNVEKEVENDEELK
uniref:Uncharacterized protein n=1 Tax=Tanacetum cinerariifolium TaxID=118510 RepID=A0A699J1V0_TANCI|nr:hypothetical protein [Tanacetum cinerariifolium]